MTSRNRIRVLQTGDLHVGRGRASWGTERSLARARKMLDEIFAVANEYECDAVLVAGDVFDQKNVTNEERELVAGALASHSAAMPTFVTAGNHDLKSNSNSNLDFLAEVTEKTNQIPGLHVAHANSDPLWTLTSEPTPLYILGASCPLSESQKWVEDRVKKLDDEQVIFVGHGTVKGCARNDSGWRPDDEDDHGVSLAEASKSKSVVWWAYGDIHKRQELPTLAPGANGWYAGSPIQMDFGETPDRGVLIITFEWGDDSRWRFESVDYVRMDDRGFAPLVTVTDQNQLEDLPKEALIRLEKGLVLPTERHAQVVKTISGGGVVVEDRSTPEAALPKREGAVSATIETFDPLMASLSDVETEALAGVPALSDAGKAEVRHLVGQAVNRYRDRVFLS